MTQFQQTGPTLSIAGLCQDSFETGPPDAIERAAKGSDRLLNDVWHIHLSAWRVRSPGSPLLVRDRVRPHPFGKLKAGPTLSQGGGNLSLIL